MQGSPAKHSVPPPLWEWRAAAWRQLPLLAPKLLLRLLGHTELLLRLLLLRRQHAWHDLLALQGLLLGRHALLHEEDLPRHTQHPARADREAALHLRLLRRLLLRQQRSAPIAQLRRLHLRLLGSWALRAGRRGRMWQQPAGRVLAAASARSCMLSPWPV